MIRFMKIGWWFLFAVAELQLVTFISLRVLNDIHEFMPRFIILKLGVLHTGICGFGQFHSSEIFNEAIGTSFAFFVGTVFALCGVYELEESQKFYAEEKMEQARDARNLGVTLGLFALLPLALFFYAEVFNNPIADGDGGQIMGLLRYFLLDQPPQQW